MKIHGTAKGGALSTKDFGVAFGGAAAAAGCSNFEDSLGTDANGTNSGSTINTSDQKLGEGCVSLDGVNDYVNIDGASAFSTTVGSISLWLRPGLEVQDDTVLSFADTSTNENLSIRVENEVIYVLMRLAAATQWEASKTGITVDTWHQCVLVQDGSAVKFYVDNTEITTFAVSTDKSKWLTANIDNARIGCVNRNNYGNIDFWNGLVDDIGLWNTAIDSTTRDFLWNSGDGNKISSLTSCSGIRAYYNCDEFDNSTLTNNAVPI